MKVKIDTIVDLDLTDLFFNLYKDDEYFSIDSYDPIRFKERFYRHMSRYGDRFANSVFTRIYSSPAYSFNTESLNHNHIK